MNRLILWALIALALVCIIVGVGWVLRSQSKTINTLSKDNATLQAAVRTQGETIDGLVGVAGEWQAATIEAQRTAEQARELAWEARQETRRLDGIFSRHNLEELAAARPGLIEDRINRGTSDAFRMWECATGNPDVACDGAEAD